MMSFVKANQRGAALLVGALSALSAASARAQECQADADCGPGYQCKVGTSVGCGGSTCAKGDDCPPPVCESFEYHYCAAAPCTTDADCPGSMVCHTESWEACSAPASPPCARGQVCDASVEEPTCTRGSQSSCTERYNLPCEADADCGPGFECVESVIGSCSGGGAVRVEDGGVVFEPGPTECTSEPTGEFYCKLLELPCAADSDCPANLICLPDYANGSCPGGGIVGGGGTGAAGGGTFGGGAVAIDVDCGAPPPPSYSCKPPSYAGGGGTLGGASVGGTSGIPTGGVDAGAGGPGSGSVGGGALGGSSGTPGGSTPPGEDDGDDDEGGRPHHHPHHGHSWLRPWPGAGGCSLGGSAAAADLSWLALAGLLFVSRRRRG
jgi:hypothetical protein